METIKNSCLQRIRKNDQDTLGKKAKRLAMHIKIYDGAKWRPLNVFLYLDENASFIIALNEE